MSIYDRELNDTYARTTSSLFTAAANTIKIKVTSDDEDEVLQS